MNVLKTSFLLAALTALLGGFGLILDGAFGTGGIMTVGFLVFGIIMNWASYWFSDSIVLKMYGAQVVTEREAPDLHAMTRRLVQRAGMPMPRLAIIPTDMPNAFATGRDPEHGVVAVTEGILRVLNTEELEGVIAHELGHIRNRDTLVSTVAASIAGSIGTLANVAQFGAMFGVGGGHQDNEEGGGGALAPLVMIIMAIVAPIIALILQMAVSRTREFGADRAAAEMTRNPAALASALRQLEYAAEHGMEAAAATVRPGTQHMFIVSPMVGGGLAKLFSTHPPTEERIAALQKVERELRTGAGRVVTA
jgi:heat shock protein HtpX